MGKFAAYLNAALAVAWLALFFTNDALFVSHEVDLSDHLRGDAFAMAWAGSAICSRFQRLGGPPCPTRADGVRIACDRVREAFLLAGHRPASLLPPNSKKRCVAMTGKQQCERVPGGCARA